MNRKFQMFGKEKPVYITVFFVIICKMSRFMTPYICKCYYTNQHNMILS